MKLDLRSRLFVSQAAIMAAIMVLLSLTMGYFLNRTLEENLDQFLHQQADNFNATMSIVGQQITFHDLNPGFEHTRPHDEEIPFHVQALDINYNTLMLSGNLEGKSLYSGGPLPHEEKYETIYVDSDKVRRLTTPLKLSSHHVGWIIITLSYHYLDNFRDHLYQIITFATISAIFLLTMASFLFVKWSLRPVLTLANQVNEQTQENNFVEIPIPEGDDEFAYLTRTFNELLARAKSAMEALERFSADASHELKTPLAIMKSELIRAEERGAQHGMPALGTLHAEISRMQQLIENLLILSQTDIPYHMNPEELWLNDFIVDETSRIQQVTHEKNIQFDLDHVHSLKIRVDSYLLYLIYNNLLRNAVKYSSEEGTVKVSCEHNQVDGLLIIQIRDDGPGIPDEDLHLIFDRFYRLDSSRSRYRGGSGLGLSIAKWAGEKLKATVTLENHESGGLVATIRLPYDTIH